MSLSRTLQAQNLPPQETESLNRLESATAGLVVVVAVLAAKNCLDIF
ncbi:MAG: hypothetical protein SFY66_02755 [Oculatellaceae cyanobacterium bins.114]|nr:hypothetical protein [Oculatellaceae cyanobacterium bins.114]